MQQKSGKNRGNALLKKILNRFLGLFFPFYTYILSNKHDLLGFHIESEEKLFISLTKIKFKKAIFISI